MASYFNGNPEIQGDGLQTLILMNPAAGYVGYSDTQSTPAGNLVFLNSPASFAHAPDASSEISALHGILQRPAYWAPIDNPTEAREVHRPQQGLSLTLSPQQPPYIYAAPETVLSPPPVLSPPREEPLPISLLGSKYLKAAQQLLDEVVNVVGESRTRSKNFHQSPSAMAGTSELQIPESSIKRDLTAAEKQEIQLKKTKLFSMLDQVEQKYREYHNQMSIVISTFEQIAGIGSARSYTGLALQTISKQFRSLKDAINAQIRAANKCLGEEESAQPSRFKLVDHHIRQQRALQQLGMIQHNAWRPQRGLPERSVSILRAWLFEHFLHPYPKDSDKHMLAKQTGLTRSQVSNWFINARVRLWKPMVEEMYLEEIKEKEKKSNPYVSKDSDISTTQDSPKRQRTPEASVPSIAADVDPVIAGSSSPAPGSLAGHRDGYPGFVPGFGSYPIAASYSGNGVSLTLGLPHCENLGLSAAHQNFLPSQLGRRVDMSEHDFAAAAAGQPPHGYESIDMDSRKRFAAQLLPDFVT